MNKWGNGGVPFIFIFDYELKWPLLFPLEDAAKNGVYFKIVNHNNIDYQDIKKRKFIFKKYPVPYPVFKKSYDRVLDEIQLGNSFLTNLTFPTPIETDLTLKEIFTLGDAPYKLLYKDQFVVFSPEPFVKTDKGKISTFPMKGTIDATVQGAATKILNDPKETAEHHTIVDLMRNDLSQVATNIKVEKFRFLDTIRTNDRELLQVSSEITGQLPENYPMSIGDLLLKLLPAGSVTGAPKKKTLEIISRSEIYERGFYTGVFGIFDGTDLLSAVMIRFIEKVGDRLIFKSGGGITALSDPLKEYQELTDKVYVPIY